MMHNVMPCRHSQCKKLNYKAYSHCKFHVNRLKYWERRNELAYQEYEKALNVCNELSIGSPQYQVCEAPLLVW